MFDLRDLLIGAQPYFLILSHTKTIKQKQNNDNNNNNLGKSTLKFHALGAASLTKINGKCTQKPICGEWSLPYALLNNQTVFKCKNSQYRI